MTCMGRPRLKIRDLPLGVYMVKGRYYARPVNAEMREIFSVRYPGRKSAPLGSDKSEARKQWVSLFTTERRPQSAIAGTVAEIIERYVREILPTLHPKTKPEHKRYCKTLNNKFGAVKFARSEVEAASGQFLRSMDVTRYLREQEVAERPVAANKEVQCLSRMFRLAKTLWGYTEYNPVLQVEYNHEEPRSVYVSDADFMKIYEKAPPVLQCMMDLAQMHGARRGMLIRLTLADISEHGLRVTINKKKRTDRARQQIIRWNDDLRSVIDRAIELRAKVRGGQKVVADATSAPLFLTKYGKPYGESAFNSMWQRARAAAGFEANELHFHDIKAKSVSDSPDEIDAMNRGGHLDLRTTRGTYRRKPMEVIPLPQVSKKTRA